MRDTRTQLGWSQAELGRRCGLAQTTISAIERTLGEPSLRAVAASLDALGIRLEIRLRPPFIDRRSQADAVHARCGEYVVRRLQAAGWLVDREVEIQTGRSHGWIDMLAFDPAARVLLVIEVKTELHDLGELKRTLSWYERMAWQAAHGRGWRPVAANSILVILATEAVEERLRQNRATIDQDFPIHGTTVRRWMDGDHRTPLGGRGIALIDPSRRGATWLRSSRRDGSRAATPYADYADAARRLTRPRRPERS